MVARQSYIIVESFSFPTFLSCNSLHKTRFFPRQSFDRQKLADEAPSPGSYQSSGPRGLQSLKMQQPQHLGQGPQRHQFAMPPHNPQQAQMSMNPDANAFVPNFNHNTMVSYFCYSVWRTYHFLFSNLGCDSTSAKLTSNFIFTCFKFCEYRSF